MKKAVFVLVCAFLFSVNGFSQDTVRIETVRVDTFKVETVRVDTVLIQQSKTQPDVKVNEVQATNQQVKKPAINQNKLYFGGYVNASIGSYSAVGIEPLVGYKLTPKFSVGGKLSYEYINDKRYSSEYTASNYGFSLFTRLRVTQRLYAHTEYSAMNYKLYEVNGNAERKWVPFLFLGGGFSQPVSKNTWLTAEVLFDVLQNENSPYKNWEPFFSVGFGVGF